MRSGDVRIGVGADVPVDEGDVDEPVERRRRGDERREALEAGIRHRRRGTVTGVTAAIRSGLREPHVTLALGALVVVAAEAAYAHRASDAWLLVEVVAATAALVRAWREQDRLRLLPVLALGAAFDLAYVGVHLAFGVRSDFDSRVLYKRYGERLLHGHYPHAEYPVGAVLLFAWEAWISRGATRVANAFTMIPFQALTVGGVWALRTRYAPWLAAALAFFPLNPYFWEFKFDLVPAAMLVLGIVFARRERWAAAGVALALGTVVKWTPGLAFAVLFAWLLSTRRIRNAAEHAAAFVVTVLIVYVPFLLWDAHDVTAAYSRQNTRVITPESLWYLPLHVVGLAHVKSHISFGAGAPHWANVAAQAIQVTIVVVLIVAATRVRERAGALAIAALTPAAFLVTNRIFSPQFILVIGVGIVVAAALLVRSRREQLAVGVAFGAASVGNAFVYPYALPHYTFTWQLASLALFACASALIVWLTLRAVGADRGPFMQRPRVE